MAFLYAHCNESFVDDKLCPTMYTCCAMEYRNLLAQIAMVLHRSTERCRICHVCLKQLHAMSGLAMALAASRRRPHDTDRGRDGRRCHGHGHPHCGSVTQLRLRHPCTVMAVASAGVAGLDSLHMSTTKIQ